MPTFRDYCRAGVGFLRQVFLVVEPKFEWDAGAVKRRERAVKRAKIAAAELFRTSPLDENPSGSTAEGQPAFVSSQFQFFGCLRGAAAVVCVCVYVCIFFPAGAVALSATAMFIQPTRV